MNEYPVQFKDKAGNIVNAVLVCEVTLATQFWTIAPAPDGNGYSGFPTGVLPPPSIATIPNIDPGTSPITVDMTQYVTGSYDSLTIASVPSGVTFDGTTLTITAPSTAGSLQLALHSSAATILSNVFTVPALVSGLAADTIAPTVPVGVQVALNASGVPVVTFITSNDPYDGTQVRAGNKQYVVSRSTNGGAYSNVQTIAAASTGDQFVAVPQDIGSPAVAGSTVQAGAQFTMTGGGLSWFSPSDQGQYAPDQVTGNFDLTWRVVSASCAGNPTGAICGAAVRQDLTAGSIQVTATCKPFSGGTGYSLDTRAANGGAGSSSGDTANSTANLYMRLHRVGNVFTMYASLDPNALATNAAQVAQATIVMGAQVYVGPMASARKAASTMSCVIDQWNITQDAQVSWTDAGATVTAGTVLAYKVTAADLASPSNVSATSAIASVTVPAAASGVLSYFQGLKAASPPYIVIGQHGVYYGNGSVQNSYSQMKPASNPTAATVTIPAYLAGSQNGGTDTGKCVGILGISMGTTTPGAIQGVSGTYSSVYGGSGINMDGLTLGKDWLSTNPKGVLSLSSWFMNPLTGNSTTPTTAQMTQILTTNSSAQATFFTYVDSLATLIKGLGGPVLYRPFVENNLAGETYGPNIGNANQIALYKLIWNRMMGAPNNLTASQVIWCYNINDSFGGSPPIASFLQSYPGDQYVDIMTFDTYTQLPGTHAVGTGLRTALLSKGKPIGIFEAGAGGNNTPGIYDNNEFVNDIITNFPEVVFIIFWTQGWALSQQPGAASVMTNSKIITRTNLPAGI